MARTSPLRLVAAAGLGYLLGSAPTADAVSRIATRGTIDLREAGTGNPGAANAIEVLGKKWGAAVFVGDFVKGVLAALVGRSIAGDDGACVAATAAVAGHNWPVWNGFRGGKGVATAAGATVVVFPPAVPFVGTALAVGAVSPGGAEIAVAVAAPVWIAETALWTRRGWSTGWGAEAGIGVVLNATATSALVLGKFAATSSSRSRRRPE